MMAKCCLAWRAWRAGVSIEDARLIYELGCDGERLETCRKAWQIKEKVDLYNAQSDQALDGDSKLLQHLGRAVLNQGEPIADDPGIGDLVFVLPGDFAKTATNAPQRVEGADGTITPLAPSFANAPPKTAQIDPVEGPKTQKEG